MRARHIVLYSHHGCLGGQAAVSYLARHGLPFTLRDVGADVTARSEWRALGGFPTPVLVVDGRVLVGFDPKELEEALARDNQDLGRGG